MSLQYLYRIPAQTIGQIVPETCEAITEVLKDHFKVQHIAVEMHIIHVTSSSLVDGMAEKL